MSNDLTAEQPDEPEDDEYPRYIQLKFRACEAEVFEQVKDSKEEHGLDWKELVTFASITLAEQDVETSGANIARALKELAES
jgi:hypothetical protein